MNLIQSAIAKVKNLANTYINKVAKPMAVGAPQVRQYFNPADQNKYVDTVFNKITNIPRYELPQNFLPQTNNKVLQFGQGLVRGAIESPLNIPRNLLVGYGRIQKENLNLQRGNGYNFGNALAGAGNLVEAGLDLSTFGIGKGIAKGAIEQTAKTGVIRAIKRGAIQGAGVGAVGGGAYGVGNQYNKKFNLGEVAMGAGAGALIGGVLGGGIAGVGSIKRQTTYSPELVTYLRNAKGQFKAGDVPVKPPMMPKPQWESNLKINTYLGRNPYTPVYSKDLQEYFTRGGLSVKKLTKFEHDQNVAIGDITGWSAEQWSKNKLPLDQVPTPVLEQRLQQKISGGEATDIQLTLQKRNSQPSSVPTEGITGVPEVTKGVESMPEVTKTQGLPTKVSEILPEMKVPQSKPLLSQTPQKLYKDMSVQEQALEDIISQGRKQIGGKIDEPKVSFKQSMDNLYTQWVDRYNPIVKASKKAKEALKTKGASLRPEFDPEYLVRRLTGAGGIADNRFREELNPLLKEVEKFGIPKIDLDTYLVNKRIAGFGSVGRDIYGADPVKAGEITMALDQKYGPELGKYADELYKYQDKGFQEMIDAGFISPENAQIIKNQNPDYSPLYRVMDDVDEYLGLPTRKTMQGTQPIQKIKGSKRQIESPVESIIGNTFRQRAAIEKNRVAKSIVSLNEIAPELGFKKVSKSADDTITVWNNGQKEFFQVGKDIADVAKGANEEAMNLVLKVLQAPAALLRQGATGRNPEFMIPNVVRDQLDAGITSKYGYVPFVDYVSGLKSMISKDDIYQKWANSGAKIDLGEMSGKKSIKQLFETAKSREGLFKKLGKVLDVMGKYSEQPTRIGLFKKAYKKTGNEMLAMLESRDATVDFARMGSKMKVANSIVPFLNVGIQGFDKLIRTTKNNPMKVLFNASLYGLAPAATLAVYNLKNYPQEYSEIPQYEKDNNFVVVLGRNEDGTVDYATFPKGNIIPVVANPVESFINYSFGNDQESFGELALQVLGGVLPVVSEGRSMGEIGLKTIGSNLPQAFKPIAENLTNKSFYKYDTKKEQSKEIVPYFLQDEPDYKQTYKFTPKLYQAIGAVTDTSPLKVQNLLEGYLAGYIKIPAQIVEMAVKMSNNEKVSPNEKTLLRRFIKQTYPTSKKKLKVKKETPGLMERVTGEIKAAEKIAVSAIPEEEKDALVSQFKESGKTSEVVGDRLYYRTDTGTSSVSMNFEVETPKYTGNTLIDNELKADYKGEITKAKNAVMKAFEMGAIDQKKAMEELSKLKVKTTGTKKPKKLKIKSPKFVPIKIGKTKKITGLTKKKKFKLIRAKKLKGVKL